MVLTGINPNTNNPNLANFVQAATKVVNNQPLNNNEQQRIQEFIDTETNPINNNWSINFNGNIR